MEALDERRLEVDVYYRFQFLARFVDFDESDLRTIQNVAPELLDRLDPIMDEIYRRFRDFDATWRHFSVQAKGCPMTTGARHQQMEALTVDHGSMVFRKHKLVKYFRYIMLRPFDRLTIRHLDQMARKHRGASEVAPMRIPLVQMNAFMAFISDRITGIIMEIGLDHEAESATLRAVQKLIWLQSDLISRHYQHPSSMFPSANCETRGPSAEQARTQFSWQ